MRQLSHKEVSSRGDKNSWKNKSPKERNMIMKERWLIRRMNSEVNKAIDNN